MPGIDFVDTIVVRRTIEKGTKIVPVTGIKPLKWAGQSFKEKEIERLQKAGDPVLAARKGTEQMKLSAMKMTQVPNPAGHVLVTGRGTGIRISG